MAGCRSPQRVWEYTSSKIVHLVEQVFYNLGIKVAQNPWKTVVVSWLFVLLSCLGLIQFHIEKNPMNLWVPPESDFFIDTQWYMEKFGNGFRFQKVLATAENVLDPKVLMWLNDMNKRIQMLNVTINNKTFSFEDLCFKIPVVQNMNSNTNTRRLDLKNNDSKKILFNDELLQDMLDPTLLVDSQLYCTFLEHFPLHCLEDNILDIWKYDPNQIRNLSQSDVITQVNDLSVSPSTGHPVDYKNLLGGIEYDSRGQIVSAKSIIFVWYAQVNFSSVDLNEVGNLVGTEDWVTKALSLWEKEFLELMHSLSQNVSTLNLTYEAGRSYGDISNHTMFLDMDKLFMVNVLGWMQKWGMTVDIVCCIGLELAIGLCVDYAAHVGHTFLTIAEGSLQERSLKTVTSIGSAVLFGGVMLSLIGPRGYHNNIKPTLKDNAVKAESVELNGKPENVDED
ncbi:NPC intracellular cholesterol transporter 1 [Eumeta japonica]|uniref:NPC intracellular cholesterol transporter 1 n=1 Tax=Eumeta variegata TaxID=151549 RepID=A0A4C1VJT3_EUMVA|nr:NPC intracellular cholesterol transporter 1 [Eumeta japonica]